jgi:hypothetical protein
MFAADGAPWQNPRVLLTLLLVFLAGACAGGIVVHERSHGYGLGNPANLSYERLKTDLNLTSDQAEQIRSILDDFVKFNEDLKAQIDDTRATGKNRIMIVLNPDQKKRFERICAEMQNR